jgi:hypothetical protein
MFLSFRKKTDVSSLKKGETSVIEGAVRAAREMVLPADGLKCVFYELMTEVYKKGERGTGRPLWFPEKLERKTGGFFVCDSTGEVYVDCPAENMMIKGGYRTAGFMDKKGRRRFNARLIREGDIVRVRGIVADPSAAGSPDALSLLPNRKGRMEIIAKPKK